MSMRSPCALLIAAFLITGCGARKVQPIIVRESVTLRGQRGPTPQPDARPAVAPAPSRPAAAEPAKTPRRNRDEVGVTGLTAEVPRAGDATVNRGDAAVPQPVDSAAPPPPVSPEPSAADTEPNSAAPTAQRAGRGGSSLLIV